MTRTARKRHRCDRQIYYDRLSPEAREWHHVTPCPAGGWIEVGTTYEEDEGADPFHPAHFHPDCLTATAAMGAHR